MTVVMVSVLAGTWNVMWLLTGRIPVGVILIVIVRVHSPTLSPSDWQNPVSLSRTPGWYLKRWVVPYSKTLSFKPGKG